MGYSADPDVLNLKFEDRPGLEVKATSVSLGELLDLMELIDGPMSRENTDQLFTKFSKLLVGWNVELKGKAVPATVKGLYSLDLQLAVDIITGWRDAVSGVDAPLEESSAGGDQSLAESIPMAPLSESLVS